MVDLDLSRQAKLIDYDKINSYQIKVFGVGSVGSHTVNVLAKSGFRNIEVFDMDTVDAENIAAQAFRFSDIGKNKVDAIKDIVLDSAGIEIKTNHGAITADTVIEPLPNTIYCCFFDSFEARRLIYEKLKDFPVIFVDARIGRFDKRHYLINCSNAEENSSYYASLQTGKDAELACGEKASAPINYEIAGQITMNIINYIMGNDYDKIYIGNALAPSTDMHILIKRPIKSVEPLGIEEIDQLGMGSNDYPDDVYGDDDEYDEEDA